MNIADRSMSTVTSQIIDGTQRLTCNFAKKSSQAIEAILELNDQSQYQLVVLTALYTSIKINELIAGGPSFVIIVSPPVAPFVPHGAGNGRAGVKMKKCRWQRPTTTTGGWLR